MNNKITKIQEKSLGLYLSIYKYDKIHANTCYLQNFVIEDTSQIIDLDTILFTDSPLYKRVKDYCDELCTYFEASPFLIQKYIIKNIDPPNIWMQKQQISNYNKINNHLIVQYFNTFLKNTLYNKEEKKEMFDIIKAKITNYENNKYPTLQFFEMQMNIPLKQETKINKPKL